MNRILTNFSFCWYFLYSITSSANTDFIEVVTEDGYPLQYFSVNKVRGPTTELVEAVLAEAKL